MRTPTCCQEVATLRLLLPMVNTMELFITSDLRLLAHSTRRAQRLCGLQDNV